MDNLDIQNMQIVLTPIVKYFTALVLSGAITTALTELMKNKYFPWDAAKYKRLTAAFNALLATLVAIYLTPIQFALTSAWQIVAFWIGALYIAAKLYNDIIKRDKSNGHKATR